MVMREIKGGEVKTFRQKGTASAQAIVRNLSGDLSPSERFEKLGDEFRLCADRCFNPIIDNFNPFNFFWRGNHRKGDELKIMLLGAFQASSKMEEIVRQMGTIVVHTTQENRQAFLVQKDEADRARCRMHIAQDLYETNTIFRLASLKDAITLASKAVNDGIRDLVHTGLHPIR